MWGDVKLGNERVQMYVNVYLVCRRWGSPVCIIFSERGSALTNVTNAYRRNQSDVANWCNTSYLHQGVQAFIYTYIYIYVYIIWNEMKWNGMEWNGMEWNGME